MLELGVQAHVLQAHDDLARIGDLLVVALVELAADHEVGQVLAGGALGVQRLDGLAVAQDGHLVGDAHDLAHLVRDEDDRLALGGEGVDDVEQALDLDVGEDGGGLVENDEVRAADEHLHDLHALLHADGHLGDLLVKVHLEAVAVCELLDLLLVSGAVELGARALGSKDDVLEAGHGLDQHEVLVHHADAQGHRVGGALDPHLFAAVEDLAVRGLVETHEDVHERGLASAVLAQQGVDLSLVNHEVHVPVGVLGTEALADVLHPQQFCHVIPLSSQLTVRRPHV